MKNIIPVLKKQFGVDCTAISEVHGGLSAMNYKIETDAQRFFLKVYDKKKAQSPLWTANIDCYMPILVWLNENMKLKGRIVQPLKTVSGDFRFDDDEHVFLLFDFIEGETIGKTLTRAQLAEIADIMACLHRVGGEIPVDASGIREDFSVPFCFALEQFLSTGLSASPADIQKIIQPCLAQLILKNNEVKRLSEKLKHKNVDMVLCHTDAHGYNLIQGRRLMLVDWEGIKVAPPEADLLMFTKKEYWDVFIGQYCSLRPDFALDPEILLFYILRRKIEDIWAFIEGLLADDLSADERVRDLDFFAQCCAALDDLWFEL